MPSRNSRKLYADESHYHVYNRGVNKQEIFLDKNDYAAFLNLFKRYLGKETVTDKKGRKYEQLGRRLDLIAFCLMPNHFHLFIFQKDKDVMSRLLQGVCGAYTVYFNKKYARIGPLFQGRFKASLVSEENYYIHLTRYIHLNPKDYMRWDWSSLPYYLGSKRAEWVKEESIMGLFNHDPNGYKEFLSSYVDYGKNLKEIEKQLADS